MTTHYRPLRDDRDWLGAAGAADLARRIEAWWAERLPEGHTPVKCRLEQPPAMGGPQSQMCFVRSNLVNGSPPRAGVTR